jgi:hypothetical protein
MNGLISISQQVVPLGVPLRRNPQPSSCIEIFGAMYRVFAAKDGIDTVNQST